MNMRKTWPGLVALVALALSLTSCSASQAASAQHARAKLAKSETTVHYADGTRFDVPSDLMGKDGLLKNGLVPEPEDEK